MAAATTSAGALPTTRTRRRARPRINGTTVEALLVFAVFALIYGVLGWRVVHDQHLIVFDATSRLAHAYFVLWNNPPKLAAIGFVWAPFSTLVFLPFVAIKPLATSLLALPLTSGVFAAAMMALLARASGFLGMPRWQRLTIVAAFGLNPMVAFYAINGMSEAPYLALLTASLYFFIRWYVDDKPHFLVLCSVATIIAILTRYELLVYGVVMAIAIPVILMRRRRPNDEVEGSLVAYVAPIVYGLGLWLFFNWLILGNPFTWVNAGLGLGGGDTPVSALGGVPQSTGFGSEDRLHLIGRLLQLNGELFPLTLVVTIGLALCWLFLRRGRQPMTLALIALVLVNIATSALLIAKSADPNLVQLRYNMRALPVAVIAAVWIWHVMPGPRSRLVTWAATLAVLLVTFPLAWHVMRTWPQQYEEKVFVRAIETGKDQEGTDPGGPYTIGNADDREMASWIAKHVPATRNGIMTDDGQTLGVMLATGRPDLFFDRIDRGDQRWKQVLKKPWGKVDYLLVARYPLPPAGIVDEVQKAFPGLRTKGYPGVSVEHANPHYVLLRVARHRPTAPPSRFEKVVDDTENTRLPRL
jgi:hypothetical protein